MGVLDASTSPPKERYAVSKDNIIKLIQPGNVEAHKIGKLLTLRHIVTSLRLPRGPQR